MSLPYTLTTHRPTQIGLVALQSDETIEQDMRRLLPPDVEFLVTRVPSGLEVTSDTLRGMEEVLTDAASLLPRGARFAAVGYGCTSGTAEIGASQIAKRIKAGVLTAAVTEPVSALIAACRQLGITRIAMISPYIARVSATLRAVLESAGITVVAFDSFDEGVEERVVRIAPSSITDAALKIAKVADCEAVFLSCTNLRTLDVIDQIERQIRIPVLSSNQVLAWHLAQLADVALSKEAPGCLCKGLTAPNGHPF